MSLFKADSIKSQLFITVVIPAKDEVLNIGLAIESILAQNYPNELFEIIVVNDHSTDDTAKVVENFVQNNVRLINLEDIPLKTGEVAFKKRAIEEAIKISKGEIIVTTDADCQHHKNWLKTLSNAFDQKKANIISGPVLFNFNNSLFQRFQALDFLGMIGITAASIEVGMFNLANGANLAFRKAVFNEVGGYSGIDQQASGDDMLLIYKFSRVDASKVLFLKSKEAIVYTHPASNLNEFVQQRLRWTSKSFGYQDHRITLILAFVYLVNVLLIVSLFCGVLSWDINYIFCFMAQFALMSIVDFMFLNKVATFFERKTLLKVFVPSQFLHVIYIIIIGLLGNVIKYNWKGRKLK
ncbi:MAG: glycosyltransferase [Chitinophagales bacterium]